MRVDIPEHKTFVDFPDGTPPEEIQAVLAKSFPPKRGITDVLKAAGSSVAAGVNQANASILERMSKGAKAVENWTGLPAGGAFEAGAQTAREGADYWRGKARGFGIAPDTLSAKVYEGVGSAPAAIAEFVAGVPMAAASGAAEGGAIGAVKSGLERFAVGKVFKGLEAANLSPVQRSGAMAGTMAAQTAAEGGNLSDVVAAGITGLALSAPTEGGRAARVRQNLQRAGVQPEIAQDLAGRSANVVPEGMGYVDTTNMDRAVPGEQPARPLVLDAEAAPRAITVRPAERGPVLDAENASRITRDPMIPGGPGDAASIEAARLRIEHPDWKDADLWEAAQRTVLANGERVPAATERDTVGIPTQDQTVWDSRIPSEFPDRRGPILDQQIGRTDPQYVASSRPFADAERAPRPEESPRFYNPEVLPTPTERDARPVVREPVATAEDAPRPAPLNPPSMENFNHDNLPTAAVTAADSLTVPPSVKAAVVGTPAEISALVQPGKAVLRNGDKAYLIDRAEAAEQFGSLAEAKKMLLAGGDAEAAVLGYPSRDKGYEALLAKEEEIYAQKPKPLPRRLRGDLAAEARHDTEMKEWTKKYREAVKATAAAEPLTTEAVTKSGEILTDPAEIKQAASAGDVAYAAESTPAEIRAATERVANSLLTEPSASGTVSPPKGGGGMAFPDSNFYFAFVKDGQVVHSGGEPKREFRGENPDNRLIGTFQQMGADKLLVSDKPIVKTDVQRGDIFGYTFDQINAMQQGGRKNGVTRTVDTSGAVELSIPAERGQREQGPPPQGKEQFLWGDKPTYEVKPNDVGYTVHREGVEVGFAPTKREAAKQIREGRYEQETASPAGETRLPEQAVPEVQAGGDGVPVLRDAEPDAVTLLHAGVHVPTLVKQVYDKYFRKLDTDAAPGSVKEFLDKNRDANRRWGTEPIMRWLRRTGIDQAANAQMELMRIGTPGEWARREFDAISGSTARAALVKERFRDEAMAGMSLRERQAMADLVAIERDLAIDASGKTGYTFIGGKTPAELAAAKQTFQTDYKLTPTEMARVQQATAKYFEAWKDRTQRMLDAGLISAQEKADLDAHLYSPKQFLDKIDPFTSMHGPGGKISVPDSGIHRLKEGSDAYFRNDPVALLEEAIDRTETRIARNDANKALAALPAGNGITEPAVRVGAKDWAEPPAGYETIRYMENGKQQAINVREDFAREWAQADPLVNSQLVNAIGWLSGASAVRAGSTGHNPLFAIANFPVDAMTIFLQADKRGYSPHAPVAVAQMARNVASVARDAWKHEGRYEQWVNEKGAREMLSNYGGITSRRAHLSPLMQKVSDVTSKIGRFSEEVSRLAYREQLIKNGVAPAEASKIAGEYVDFSRGGSIIKAVDRLGLPYLNAGVQGTRSVARAAGRDPVAFAYKAAQLLVGASALYGINQLVNPTGWANVSDREKADNFIIMLPPYFNYLDKDGTTVTPYIRIKKEQSVRPLLSMAEAIWQMTHEGKDATQQVKMAGGAAVPIGPDKLLPPVAKMYLAYAANLDVYRKENVWKGKQEIEPYAEYTANTNPILTRIGQETQLDGKGGVSPERLGRAVGQVIVPSNLFAKTGGALLTSAYEKMNPQERAEFGKSNYEHLVDIMKGTRLLGGAKDTEQFREGIREARVTTNTKLFEMNKPLDAMVLKYAKEGMQDPAQYEKILAYIDAAPPEHQDRLESRMEDVIETANLLDRGWWLAVKALSPEDRADQFKARLAKVDAAEQERMMQIAGELSGFTSDRFWERYDGSP